jgi:hypothetical protein
MHRALKGMVIGGLVGAAVGAAQAAAAPDAAVAPEGSVPPGEPSPEAPGGTGLVARRALEGAAAGAVMGFVLQLRARRPRALRVAAHDGIEVDVQDAVDLVDGVDAGRRFVLTLT